MRHWLLMLLVALFCAMSASLEAQTQTEKKGKTKEEPLPSKDELFQLDDDEEKPAKAATKSEAATAQPKAKATGEGGSSGLKWGGFVQEEVAYAYESPSHWSKVLTRAQLVGQGRLTSDIKWKLSGRLDYDAVFDLTDFYSDRVRDDRRLNFLLRENYLDLSAAGVDFRLGRQHIVWGEMVGLFFADVVSAKDLREFVLPEFEILRIPQWAARAEYFKNDWHTELVWIPYTSVDEIGKFGDDFFPAVIPAPGLGLQVRDDVTPARTINNSNVGLRVSVLKNGWDVAGFFYEGIDASPHFIRTIENLPGPTVVYTPRHNKIWQAGGTLAKDFGTFVVKGEAIYTRGRDFSVTDFADADGVVKQNLLDYVLGVDFSLREQDVRFNVQAFQRIFLNHVDSLVPDKYESGVSFLISGTFGEFEPQLLIIQSLNRDDRMIRPKLDWTFMKNLRLRTGVDIFSGPPTGLFGQFRNSDRAYLELRYSY